MLGASMGQMTCFATYAVFTLSADFGKMSLMFEFNNRDNGCKRK